MKKNSFHLFFIAITSILVSCNNISNNVSFEEEYLLTNIRIWQSMWDGLGNAIEYREWDSNNFIQTGKLVYETHLFGDQKRTELSNTYLLIPGAPPTCKVGGDIYIVPFNGVPVLTGKIAYITFEVPAQGKRTVTAIKTTYTMDKWVCIVNSEIYAGEDEDNMKQIGYIKYQKLESGSGKKISAIMTKGMDTDDLWHGEIRDTTYCLSPENKPEAIKRLSYKSISINDSLKLSVLMLKDIEGNKEWKGLSNRKIFTMKN